MNGQSLKSIYEAQGAAATVALLSEALKTKELSPHHFSLRELAETFCGEQWVKKLDPGYARGGMPLLEAGGDAVDVTAFGNITGQIVFSKILEGYMNEAFIGDSLVTTVPTKFSGEKIPGMATIATSGEEVHPGMPYPTFGFGEHFIETPETTKFGLIIPVTKEAIFFDRTNMVLTQASKAGERLGVGRENRILDMVIGQTNTYKERGTLFNTYQTAGTFWTNDRAAATDTLIDWTDIDGALQLFNGLRDRDSNDPIDIVPDTLIVTNPRLFTARRIVHATEIRFGDGASGTTQTITTNPVPNFAIKSSNRLLTRITAALQPTLAKAIEWWFLGQPKKAFAYMENWPITVVRAPDNSEQEFERDIIVRYKASERGAPAVLDPRYMARLRPLDP